jgi:NO-binding membrane sensor protein with MHYT domain
MIILEKDYSPGIIALTCAVGFIGSFTTISLCEQFRLAAVSQSKIHQISFMILTALAAGGVGIWSVFYLAVISLRLERGSAILPVRFHTNTCIAMLFIIPALSGLGLYVASTDHCFNKSKKEIMDMFISRATRTMSMGEIKRMGRFRILFIVCTYSLHRIVIGGFITGCALALMPFLGLLTLEFQGRVVFHTGEVVATIMLSIIGMIGGFWIFFRVLSLFSSMDSLRVLCAINGLVSLSGLQYGWIGFADFIFEPEHVVDKPSSLSSSHFIVGALCAAVIFSFVMLIYVLSDLRAWLLRTSAQLRQSDLALAALMRKTMELHIAQNGHFQAPQEVINYTRKYMIQKLLLDGQVPVGGVFVSRPLHNDFAFEEDLGPLPPPQNNDNRNNHSNSNEHCKSVTQERQYRNINQLHSAEDEENVNTVDIGQLAPHYNVRISNSIKPANNNFGAGSEKSLIQPSSSLKAKPIARTLRDTGTSNSTLLVDSSVSNNNSRIICSPPREPNVNGSEYIPNKNINKQIEHVGQRGKTDICNADHVEGKDYNNMLEHEKGAVDKPRAFSVGSLNSSA